MRERALSSGAIGFCVSGAGPTLLSLYTDEGYPARVAKALVGIENHWQVMPLSVSGGARAL